MRAPQPGAGPAQAGRVESGLRPELERWPCTDAHTRIRWVAAAVVLPRAAPVAAALARERRHYERHRTDGPHSGLHLRDLGWLMAIVVGIATSVLTVWGASAPVVVTQTQDLMLRMSAWTLVAWQPFALADDFWLAFEEVGFPALGSFTPLAWCGVCTAGAGVALWMATLWRRLRPNRAERAGSFVAPCVIIWLGAVLLGPLPWVVGIVVGWGVLAAVCLLPAYVSDQ